MEQSWDSWHVGKQHFITAERIDRQDGTKTKWITQEDYTAWMKTRGVRKPGGPTFKAILPEMIGGKNTHTSMYSIPTVHLYEGGLENFTDHYFASESISAIKKRDRRKPLLLNAMFLAPHPPFDVPDPYFSRISLRESEMPANVGKWYPGQSPLQLYNLTGFLGTRYSRQEWVDVWAKYRGLVSLLDDEVGRIIKALKEEGLYDESIIVFTADHGEMLGSHNLWQKMCMYEESARVPLFIKFPDGFQTGTRSVAQPVSLIDVFPTLLDFTGVTIQGKLDGRSLLPLVLSKTLPPSPVFIQYDGNGSLGNFQRCVVDGDFKLIVDIFKDEVFLELYQVMRDPEETKNLAFDSDYEQRVSAMINLLRKHMLETGDRLTLPEKVYRNFLEHYKPN
jgi:choline-sulfatase